MVTPFQTELEATEFLKPSQNIFLPQGWVLLLVNPREKILDSLYLASFSS